jgi:predicted component of type VI protein secretion system
LADRDRLALAERLGAELQRATEELQVLERRRSNATTLRCRRLIEDTNRDVLRLFQSSAAD